MPVTVRVSAWSCLLALLAACQPAPPDIPASGDRQPAVATQPGPQETPAREVAKVPLIVNPDHVRYIDRIEVSVGDDSCYTAPLTTPERIAPVIRLANSLHGGWSDAEPWLGGVHAWMYRGDTMVAVFGMSPDRAHFEFGPPGKWLAQPATERELDEFLRLVGLPPGTNAGVGLPVYPCPG
jgi:hypothetical protein